MIRVLALLCVWLGLFDLTGLSAHNRDMYNLERLIEVRLRPGALDLRLAFQHREFTGLAVRTRMDLNADGFIDEDEARQYAFMLRDSLLARLSVRLEGRELSLTGFEDPRIDFYGVPRPVPQHLDLTFDFTAALDCAGVKNTACDLEIENRNTRSDPGRETFVLIASREMRVDRTSLDSTHSPVTAEDLRRVRLDFSRLDPGELSSTADSGGAPWRLVLDRWCDHPAAGGKAILAEAAPIGTDSLEHSAFQARVSRFFEQGRDGGEAIWLLVLAAFVYGCFHALEPGHAKTITAVYLLGSGQRWTRALLLALIVTITHTGGVLLLALATSLAWGGAPGPAVQAALTGVSGLIVLALGIQRLRSSCDHGHDHPHPHKHEHSHEPMEGQGDNEHGHSHVHPDHSPADKKESRWGVVWLGVAGGLAPCPGALWIYFLALGFGRPALAVLLIISLSLGLAVVLVTVGLVTLSLGDIFTDKAEGEPLPAGKSRILSVLRRAGSRAAGWAPLTAGVLLVLAGAFMLWRGLAGLGLSSILQ